MPPCLCEQANAFLLKNLDGLLSLYADDSLVELVLKETNLKAPYTKKSTAKKLWLEWQSRLASAELLSLLVHPKLTMAKVGVIDTSNKWKQSSRTPC